MGPIGAPSAAGPQALVVAGRDGLFRGDPVARLGVASGRQHLAVSINAMVADLVRTYLRLGAEVWLTGPGPAASLAALAGAIAAEVQPLVAGAPDRRAQFLCLRHGRGGFVQVLGAGESRPLDGAGRVLRPGAGPEWRDALLSRGVSARIMPDPSWQPASLRVAGSPGHVGDVVAETDLNAAAWAFDGARTPAARASTAAAQDRSRRRRAGNVRLN